MNPLNNLSRNDRESIGRAKKNNKKPPIRVPENNYPEIAVTASAAELTGLMRTAPQDDDELEAYQDLGGMPAPKKKGARK